MLRFRAREKGTVALVVVVVPAKVLLSTGDVLRNDQVGSNGYTRTSCWVGKAGEEGDRGSPALKNFGLGSSDCGFLRCTADRVICNPQFEIPNPNFQCYSLASSTRSLTNGKLTKPDPVGEGNRPYTLHRLSRLHDCLQI